MTRHLAARVITQVGRHWVIKWARFFLFLLLILHFGCWLVCGLMTRSLLSADHVLRKYKMATSDVCFACLTWLYELFVGMLISLMNAYASCGRPTLNFSEHIDLGRSKGHSVPTVKPLHLITYVQNVDQFSMMNMNLKIFCRLCLILYGLRQGKRDLMTHDVVSRKTRVKNTVSNSPWSEWFLHYPRKYKNNFLRSFSIRYKWMKG